LAIVNLCRLLKMPDLI